MRSPIFVLLPCCVLAGVACGTRWMESDTPYPGTPPPIEEVAPERDRTALVTIENWMREFRDRQVEERDLTGRYGGEVTLDGRIQPLDSPHETRYSVHPVGRSYYVEVRHPPTRRSCKLEAGDDVHAAGQILCRRY